MRSTNNGEPVRLCALSELPDPGSRGFSIRLGDELLELFVVHRQGRVTAYRNSCPHTGGPLDWMPDQFLDLQGREIQCASHDARFRIDDGFCIAGPCAGRSLAPVSVSIVNGDVVLDTGRQAPSVS